MPALEEDRQEGNSQAEEAGGDKDHRAEGDAIGIVREPLPDKVGAQRCRDYKRNPHVDEECADEAHQDGAVIGPEHLADRYLLRALLDKIGGHRQQTQQRDQDRDAGKDHHDLGQTDLPLEMRLDALIDILPLERNAGNLFKHLAHLFVGLHRVALQRACRSEQLYGLSGDHQQPEQPDHQKTNNAKRTAKKGQYNGKPKDEKPREL